MSEWAHLGLRELRGLLADKKVSPAELLAYFHRRAKAADDLNAFAYLDEFKNNGDKSDGGDSLLAGIPIAHKSIFCRRDGISHCGSKMLEKFVSPYDATVVAKCRAAGMRILGMTQMDEFAMGSSGEHNAFGATRNPWQRDCVPGGSSSGSAAAVAARLVPAATGTDTGGSIRQPAAFCGVCGIKPTYGRVSRWGMVAFASGFDQGGVFATNAEDCALMLNTIAGFDEKDSTSLAVAEEDFTRLLSEKINGRVLGVPKEFFADGLDDSVATPVREAIAQLEKLGAKIVEVSLPSVRYAIAAYYVLTCAEASSNLSRYDGVRYGYRTEAQSDDDLTAMIERTRSQGFGREVKRRIFIGAYVLSYGYYDAYYRRAMKVRRLIADDFARVFGECDALVGPTTPNVAFAIGAVDEQDPVAMYQQDIYTVPVNLAGLPAMSVPCGLAAGLPVGLQIIGAPQAEATVLSIAHQFQQHSDFHRQLPPGV